MVQFQIDSNSYELSLGGGFHFEIRLQKYVDSSKGNGLINTAGDSGKSN